MKYKENKNLFSILWGISLIILLFFCIFGFNNSFKGTRAYFGDSSGTGDLSGNIYSVFYYRNWPNIDDIKYVKNQKYNITRVLSYDELFDSLEGYRFTGWNTAKDGSGISFDVEYTFKLTADINLYAQWSLIISYGDVNKDGIISEDDYLLIEKHINGENILVDNSLINADVNNDGMVDLVDVDIVKQTCLGTVGYVGYLPNTPILIYDIYEGNIDIGTDNSSEDVGSDKNTESGDNKEDNNDKESVDSGGNGLGNNGTGSGTTGNSQGGASLNGTSGGSSSNNNISDATENIEIDREDNNENIDNNEYYEFKFINGNSEYFSSRCLVVDGSCELILPNNNPIANGYRFTGWSLKKGCPEGSGIVNSIYVESGNTYYACFVTSNKKNNNVYLWIIVLGISIISIKLIWNLINEFRKKNNENIND